MHWSRRARGDSIRSAVVRQQAPYVLKKSFRFIFAGNFSFMQSEDDLRGLAKVVQFMRAISVIFIVLNIYWFCYE